MAKTSLSMLAEYDDLRRFMEVLIDGTAEEEFLRVLRLQQKYREECLNTAQEARRIQKELDASLKSMADLETKLFHARRLLENESKARRHAERQRDDMERKIFAVADLLQHERNLKNETKDQLEFLKNTLPRKRKSVNAHIGEKFGEINNTGSFLSELSITQSEDDFLDVNYSRNWQKHRPSVPKNAVPCVGTKRSRLSGNGAGSAQNTPQVVANSRRSGARRSIGIGVQQHTLDVGPGVDHFCATTKVTIPQDGTPIRAESTIETVPCMPVEDEVEIIGDGPHIKMTTLRPSNKEPKAAPMTPKTPAVNKFLTTSNANTPYGNSPSQQNRPTLFRQHNFASKTFIRAELCAQCQKKIRFGAVGLRCKDCPIRCHVDCSQLLKITCVPQTGTPTLKGLMGYISNYAPSISPMVPALIVHCVNEIEQRGLQEVGIYRVSGSERDVKALKERFLRNKTIPNLTNIDVHVLSCCIKDFLRSLREPLVPTNLWKDFCNAAQDPKEENVQAELCKAFEKLPQANRDTLAFLILHFRRIADCPEIRMPIENISRVFGPTIIGYSTPDPDQYAMLMEVHTQCSVMLNLLQIPVSYFQQFVLLESSDKENEQHTASTLMRTPHKNKETIYSLYATPQKSTMKKRRFYDTPK